MFDPHAQGFALESVIDPFTTTSVSRQGPYLVEMKASAKDGITIITREVDEDGTPINSTRKELHFENGAHALLVGSLASRVGQSYGGIEALIPYSKAMPMPPGAQEAAQKMAQAMKEGFDPDGKAKWRKSLEEDEDSEEDDPQPV